MPRGWRASATPSSRRRNAPSGSASTRWRCIARTAICCISSCRRSPTGAPTSMADRWKIACAIRWKCSTRCARRFRQQKPVGIKVSSTDWVDGGWDIAQTIELAKELKKRGVDWIDASSGGVSPLQKIPLGPGYQVQFAEAIKQAAGVNTIAVGLITEAKQAEDIVASGKADMVALARGMLYDPRWGWHAAAATRRPRRPHRRPTGARHRTSRRSCSARPRSGRGDLVIASEAKQSSGAKHGLLRRYAPRNDGDHGYASRSVPRQSRTREPAIERLLRHHLAQDSAHADQFLDIDPGGKTLALAQEHQVLEHHIAGGAGRERAAAEAAERAVENPRAGIERRGRIRNSHAAGVVQVHADRLLARDSDHRGGQFADLLSGRHIPRCRRPRRRRRRPRSISPPAGSLPSDRPAPRSNIPAPWKSPPKRSACASLRRAIRRACWTLSMAWSRERLALARLCSSVAETTVPISATPEASAPLTPRSFSASAMPCAPGSAAIVRDDLQHIGELRKGFRRQERADLEMPHAGIVFALRSISASPPSRERSSPVAARRAGRPRAG